MKVKYFPDTDTAHVEFSTGEVQETKEISENIVSALFFSRSELEERPYSESPIFKKAMSEGIAE